MKSDLVCNPIEVNKLKEFLVAEQKSINRKRTEQLYQLRLGCVNRSTTPIATNAVTVYVGITASCVLRPVFS